MNILDGKPSSSDSVPEKPSAANCCSKIIFMIFKFLCFAVLMALVILIITLLWSLTSTSSIPPPYQSSTPYIQVDSLSISVDDRNVAKWNISFSLHNPGAAATLRYQKLEVTVGGRRVLNSTAARITPMFEVRARDQSSRNATVYVTLPSARPAFIIDRTEFNVRFQTEYNESTPGTNLKAVKAVDVCGNDYAQPRPWSNVEVAMGPFGCISESRTIRILS